MAPPGSATDAAGIAVRRTYRGAATLVSFAAGEVFRIELSPVRDATLHPIEKTTEPRSA